MRDFGFTIWFTGLPSSGKTTLGQAIQSRFKDLKIQSVLLDGDVLRKGLNKDLDFSPESRLENNRRVAEVAKLFAQNGTVSIVTFISPYKVIREKARLLHHQENLPFVEIYLKTTLNVCEKRDVKGLYKLARENKISDLTGVQSIYEEPKNSDIVLDTNEMTVDQCVDIIFDYLGNNVDKGIKCDFERIRIPKHIPEYITDSLARSELLEQSKTCVSVELNEVDMQWVQVLSEGWAYPLKGFMCENQYLQCLHFSMIKDVDSTAWHIMPLPIVLAISEGTKTLIETSNSTSVKLEFAGKTIAVLKGIQIFPHRKEERVARKFTVISDKHPTIKPILESGDWLIGGDIHVIERIKWNDGLDHYRLTPNEIRLKIEHGSYDAVVAFQLRNPIHNGHVLLMNNTIQMLLKKGHKSPLLLLHPLGGKTKDDDVPLHVRIKQHEALFEEKVLDIDQTLMAIFPSPMSYAGPTEVLWHCRARMICGVSYYIVGRDPAGLPHPELPNKDLFDPTHGAKLLVHAPIISNSLKIVPFTVVGYNKNSRKMEIYDPSRGEDFLFISGTMMRAYAKERVDPPDGFMSKKSWRIVADYYSNK